MKKTWLGIIALLLVAAANAPAFFTHHATSHAHTPQTALSVTQSTNH